MMEDEPLSSIPLLVSAFLAAGTTGGTSYAFGLYGEALKEELHLSQSELDTISSASFCAGVLSWIPGLLVDKCGNKCSLVSGGVLGALALLGFWVVSREFVVVPRDGIVTLLSALGAVIYVSSALVTGSVFKIIVANTNPIHKGSAVGAAKGFVGLGSGAYAVMFEALNRKSDLDFLPMAAFFFLAAASLPALCLLPGSREEYTRSDLSTSAHYSSLYMTLIALGVLVVGQSLVALLDSEEDDDERNDQRGGPDYVMVFAVPFVWFAPIVGLLCLPTATHTILPTEIHSPHDGAPLSQRKAKSQSYRDDPETDGHEDDDEEHGQDEDAAVVSIAGNDPPDRNLAQMLTTLSAYLMLWTCIILVGGGTVMTNNMGEMAQSLRFHEKVVPAALSLFSVAQSFARVVTGSLSSMAQRRTFFLILASFAGLVAHTVLALATSEIPFVLGVFLSGLAFGMVWPLMVLISGELYGIPHASQNYMFYDGLTSAIGTLVFSKLVAQKVYNDHIVPGEEDCFGVECFRGTNWIIAGLCGTCIMTSFCLNYTRLTKQVYG